MDEIGSEQDLDKLLVFGYECKVFRDDEKARWVDSEKHLIPCMSDPSVLVDRYDCRGALMDVKRYEPKSEDADPLKHLTSQEILVEKMCDEERYRDCQADRFDDTEYQEEEMKRLQLAIGGDISKSMSVMRAEESGNYSAMNYSYEGVGDMNLTKPPDHSVEGPEKKRRKKDQPFTQPLGLYIPHDHDLVLPKTMKSHAIIEKTAKFIGRHGTQMEIILKTKQANNPQFNFLNYSDDLNPYYKYLVTAIRTHAYKPQEVVGSRDDSSGDDTDGSAEGPESPEHNGSYLHPSLVNKPTEQASLIPPSVYNYKPTAHSSYSELVSKIQEVTYTPVVESPPPPPQYYGAGANPELSTAYSTGYGQNQDTSGYSAYQGMSGEYQGPSTQMPPPDDLIIIEKMANYVIKNGPAFESLATTKGDPRFQFLDPRSPYHWYYASCKDHYRVESGAVVASAKSVPYTDGRKTESETPASTAKAESKINSSPPPPPVETKLPLVTTTTSSLFDFPPKPAPPDHANAVTRMSTLPPELISKIEELRKRTLMNKLKQSSVANERPVPSSTSTNVPGPSALLPRKENIIKFSASISQKFRQEDDVVERLELGVKKENGTKDEEANDLRKAERKRKAALFLQKLKAAEALAAVAATPAAVAIEEDKQTQIDIDIDKTEERSPPPPVITENLGDVQPSPEQADEDEVTVIAHHRKEETAMNLEKEPEHSSVEEIEQPDDPNSESAEHERRKRKSRKRSRYSSSAEDDESSTKDDHHPSRHKKSKRSKKKKKKDDSRHRSRSRSKKSKKKRH